VIVSDASAVCELLMRRPAARRMTELILADGASVHAPDLMSVEVLHVIRRLARNGAITAGRADAMRHDLADLPIHVYPARPLLARAWALRDNITVYDALYVALAEALDATLVTADHALARAAAMTTAVALETVG
jgi:predicted nucleic acid-binding protein